MYILKTINPINYSAIHPTKTATVYLAIVSQEVDYIGGKCAFLNKYYHIEDGRGKLIIGATDIIDKNTYDGLVEATINPADFSMKFDDLQRAACMGALAIISQKGTFGTVPSDWELIEVDASHVDYGIHSSPIYP